jgi:hypothetical protein
MRNYLLDVEEAQLYTALTEEEAKKVAEAPAIAAAPAPVAIEDKQ